MNPPERFEQLLAFLGSNLPGPVDQQADGDGSIEFLAGDPVEVVALLTQSSVIIFEFAGYWESPMKFVARPRRIGLVKWRRVPENALWAVLSALIKGARDARRSRFEVCQHCGRNTAPEWLHDAGVCQSCADHHSGAIH